MFTRVLLATDFSDASERTLDCVASWKSLGLQKVTLAHVHDIRTSGGLRELIQTDDEPRLAHQRARLEDAGLWVSTRLEFGTPYIEIDRIATEEGCEALVLGSHGASWLADVLLGSVADGVLRHSSLPVLIVKVNQLLKLSEEACAPRCRSTFEKLLVATDFSARAEGAIEFAERTCGRLASAVHLVHVQETSRIIPHLSHRLEEFNRHDGERLEALAARFRSAGAVSVTTEVRLDHPIGGILKSIEENDPSLVVLGSHGRGHFAEAILGSTAHGLAHLSPAPVLLVPARAVAQPVDEA